MANQTPPVTTLYVQLVHMDGPSKGRLDDLPHDRITLGRDVACHVVFPADSRAISRLHAEIVRDGARFMLINHGRNGCFINGKPADQAYLKVGDIIQLAEGGPKLSFLTASAQSASRPSPALSPRPQPTPTPRQEPAFGARPPAATTSKPTAPPSQSRNAPALAPQAAAFTLQYGTNIKTFKKASVSLGREEGVDFVIRHPSVQKKHAEIYATGDRYGLRDLTGTRETYINRRVINGDTPLNDNDILMLGDQGPQLRHLGSGRFVEVLEQKNNDDITQAAPPTEIETHRAFRDDEAGQVGFFKNLFKK
ncbi:MAG: FHA domain-containing protein [Pseudomonadota bacterium]